MEKYYSLCSGCDQSCNLKKQIQKHPLSSQHKRIPIQQFELIPQIQNLIKYCDLYDENVDKLKKLAEQAKKRIQVLLQTYQNNLQNVFYQICFKGNENMIKETISSTIKNMRQYNFDKITCNDLFNLFDRIKTKPINQKIQQFSNLTEKFKKNIQIDNKSYSKIGDEVSQIKKIEKESQFIQQQSVKNLLIDLKDQKSEQFSWSSSQSSEYQDIFKKKEKVNIEMKKEKYIKNQSDDEIDNFYSAKDKSDVSIAKNENIMEQINIKPLKYSNISQNQNQKDLSKIVNVNQSQILNITHSYIDPKYKGNYFVKVAKLREQTYSVHENSFNIQLRVVKQLSFKLVVDNKTRKKYWKAKFIGGDETGIVVCFSAYDPVISQGKTIIFKNCTLMNFHQSLEIVSNKIAECQNSIKEVNYNNRISLIGNDLNYEISDQDHVWPGVYGIGLLNKKKKSLFKKINLIVYIETVFEIGQEIQGLCRDGSGKILYNFNIKSSQIKIQQGKVYFFRNLSVIHSKIGASDNLIITNNDSQSKHFFKLDNIIMDQCDPPNISAMLRN